MVAFGDVLDSVVKPQDGTFSRELAEYVLTLRFPEAMLDRVDELGARAQQGVLSSDETTELDNYIAADTMLTVLKSKARRSLSCPVKSMDRQP